MRNTSLHNPAKQMQFIRQSLIQDKKPIGFFLGAGCPQSIKVGENEEETKPLIPDMVLLTNLIIQKLDGVKKLSQCFGFLSKFFDNVEEPSIEDLLSKIRSLITVCGKDGINGLTSSSLSDLESFICSAICDFVSKKHVNNKSPYHCLARWICSTKREVSIEIFTTNYDLLIEEALEECRVPYFDGFVGSYEPFFDPLAIDFDLLPNRWARLWKLHGSINWVVDKSGRVIRGNPNCTKERRLIFPSHLKYDQSRKMPYLSMIDNLRGFLKKDSSVLFICGYSLKDEHINDVLLQGLQGNPNAHIFCFLYGNLENYGNNIAFSIGHPNFTVLSRDAAIIGSVLAKYSDDCEGDETLIDEIAIKWKSEKDESGTKFLLGDFEKLGELLIDIVGNRTDITFRKAETLSHV